MSATLPVLLRPEDAAAVYGFSERQLRRWIGEGKIERVKLSGPTGPVFVRREALDRMIADYTVPAGTKLKTGNLPSKPKAKRRAR